MAARQQHEFEIKPDGASGLEAIPCGPVDAEAYRTTE